MQVLNPCFKLSVNDYISRGINELRNLHYLPRASAARETLVEDRTRAHADHVGQGFERATTAAVGILKALHCGQELVFETFLHIFVWSFEIVAKG